ncbi:MAG: glycosyltransferase family 39 protein [Candidatus Aminicenantes bacterium]|nr:glycosyltransferase family 39 protein [Candidatus Aminicenantes bacterium]
MDTFEQHYFKALGLIIFLLAVIVLQTAMNRGFSIDEFEHIHSAWYIRQGYTPYSDFFQHHHPLLWCLLLPFLHVFGHSADILLILRFFMFLMTLGIALLIYLVTGRLVAAGPISSDKPMRQSKEAGLLSVVFLLSTVMFVVFGIQIRPDIPQVLFGLLSLYFLIRFFGEKKNSYMVFTGFSASISFLFLQKTIFLLIAYGIIFVYKLLRREISFKPVLFFSISFLAPLSLFLFYLFFSGSMNDYILTNWLLNMNFARDDSFSLFLTLNYYILKDLLLWLFSFLFFLSLVRNRKKTAGVVNITAFICLVLLATLFLIKRPWGHNFLFPLSLLSILAGYYLHHIILKFRLNAAYRVLIPVLILLSSGYFLLERCKNTNRAEIERANFVIQNSTESDLVYDGKNRFNLFRPDLHYFWFSLKKSHGLDTYNRLTNNRFGDYDIRRLIKTKKPKFISDFRIDIKKCGLNTLYRKTPYENLYIRIDPK